MSTFNRVLIKNRAAPLAVFALLSVVLPMAGCGSTKVYTTNKSLVYRDNLYNLANVQKIGSRVEVATPDGAAVDSATLDKKQVKALLKKSDTLAVSTIIELDATDVVYERRNIDSYSDYTKMLKRHDKAKNKISKFMSDPKKTQLSLD